MRFFGSTGEPDGRGEGIWGGGLVISHRSAKKKRKIPSRKGLTAELTQAPQGQSGVRAGIAVAYG